MPSPVARTCGGGRPWTAEYLAFVLPLTPDQVLQPDMSGQGVTPKSRAEWTWIQTAQRLSWCYGPAEAVRRLNGGA
jgi:hypothetical protein